MIGMIYALREVPTCRVRDFKNLCTGNVKMFRCYSFLDFPDDSCVSYVHVIFQCCDKVVNGEVSEWTAVGVTWSWLRSSENLLATVIS
jgi:hypothetical protein